MIGLGPIAPSAIPVGETVYMLGSMSRAGIHTYLTDRMIFALLVCILQVT